MIIPISRQRMSTVLQNARFCPEIKSTGTNGPLSLKKVGHFRKHGAQYDANSLSAFTDSDKLKRLRNC